MSHHIFRRCVVANDSGLRGLLDSGAARDEGGSDDCAAVRLIQNEEDLCKPFGKTCATAREC